MKRFLSFVFFLLLPLLAVAPQAGATVSIVGSLTRQNKLQPGGTFDGVIFLKNTEQRAAEARVYQTDYTYQADGSNLYGEPASHSRSNANWITVTPTRVKLGPGETVPVRYKGKAPADPQLRGTYWSMIMIEPLTAPVQFPDGNKDVSMGMQTKIRLGVQIVTELGRNPKAQLQVVSKCLLKAEAKRFFHLDLANNGERVLAPAVSLELFDATGASVGRFEGGRARIYPTCSIRSKVEVSDVPPGKYNAMVLLDSGGDQVMGAQYELQIDP